MQCRKGFKNVKIIALFNFYPHRVAVIWQHLSKMNTPLLNCLPFTEIHFPKKKPFTNIKIKKQRLLHNFEKLQEEDCIVIVISMLIWKKFQW